MGSGSECSPENAKRRSISWQKDSEFIPEGASRRSMSWQKDSDASVTAVGRRSMSGQTPTFGNNDCVDYAIPLEPTIVSHAHESALSESLLALRLQIESQMSGNVREAMEG